MVVSDEGHVLSARHVFFPKNVEVASCRGYLATNFESEDRTVEAALDVVRGMSGAPILDSNSNIIGLILGVKFDSTGLISFTSALTSDYLAQEFQSFIKLTD